MHEPFGDWAAYADFVDFLVAMNSVVEHTQLWWSVRPHHEFGTVEFRICDAQTRAEDSTALAGLITACIAQAALDYDDGTLPEPVAGRYIEENMWRAIRYGMDGRMIDFERGEEFEARAIPERLLAWTAPARAQLGIEPALPERERRAAPAPGRRHAPGLHRRARADPADLRARGGDHVNEDEIREALKKLRVEDVLLQTAATLIDLAARRMGLAEEDGPKQLDQAKLAIDAIRALQPLMTEEQQAAVREPLSQLQMAYAREAQGAAGASETAARARAEAGRRGRAGEGPVEDLDPARGVGGRRFRAHLGRLPALLVRPAPNAPSPAAQSPTSFRRILLD